MQIIYIGNFRVPYSTETHIAFSFEELGIKVKKFQEDETSLDEVLNETFKNKYSFILYTKTWGIRGDWEKFLKEKKIPLVSLSIDLFWGLRRQVEIPHHPFFKADYVFTADGGHQKEFKGIGVNHYWLPPGVYHKECYLGKKKKEFEKDVIFVGSYNYHQEWNYRKTLINWLENTYGDRFRLWGTRETIRGDDLNNLYASAKVVVGDSTYSPYYWSDRVSETLGRGGFLIHPRVPGLEKEYRYYKDLIPYDFGDFDTLKEIIDYYIENDEEREKIRLTGHNWVKKHHTYKNRCQELLKILKKNGIK